LPKFNKVDQIKYVIVAYDKEVAIACGAIKNIIIKLWKSSVCILR